MECLFEGGIESVEEGFGEGDIDAFFRDSSL
jgi:hypothetical protein